MTAPVKVRVSEEEYLATMTDEKPSLEFVNGEVFQKPMTKRTHQDVSKRIVEALWHLERRQQGYLSYESTTNFSQGDDRRYRVPDVAFWATNRPVVQPNDIYFPPTLAIEIRSARQSMEGLREKCREYRLRGVDVCWLIDPHNRTVEVYDERRDGALVNPDGILQCGQLPGFTFPVESLWG